MPTIDRKNYTTSVRYHCDLAYVIIEMLSPGEARTQPLGLQSHRNYEKTV
ncbi:hypothetical protein [Rubritalea tangerina]